jgi:F0F1-type ATP synthase membrane subunit c/vacuolar-type H+-ATPase subunit K
VASNDQDLFSTSIWAAVGIGIGVGSAMIVIGLIVATDWRGAARRYSDFVYQQGLPWSRSTEDERFERQITMNRILFGVFALFGVALLASGISSIVARIH